MSQSSSGIPHDSLDSHGRFREMTLPDKLSQLLEAAKRTLKIISGVGGGQPCDCSLDSVHFSRTFAFPVLESKAGIPCPVPRRCADGAQAREANAAQCVLTGQPHGATDPSHLPGSGAPSQALLAVRRRWAKGRRPRNSS